MPINGTSIVNIECEKDFLRIDFLQVDFSKNAFNAPTLGSIPLYCRLKYQYIGLGSAQMIKGFKAFHWQLKRLQ